MDRQILALRPILIGRKGGCETNGVPRADRRLPFSTCASRAALAAASAYADTARCVTVICLPVGLTTPVRRPSSGPGIDLLRIASLMTFGRFLRERACDPSNRESH